MGAAALLRTTSFKAKSSPKRYTISAVLRMASCWCKAWAPLVAPEPLSLLQARVLRGPLADLMRRPYLSSWVLSAMLISPDDMRRAIEE